jgi:hypothetical protein
VHTNKVTALSVLGRRLVLVGFLGLAAFASGACKSTSTSTDVPAAESVDRAPTYVYEVTYKPGVVVVDEATVSASLLDMSDDGATFTFDASATGIDGLQPGAVVLIWGLALRKVTTVDTQGATIVVQTDPAALTDAIQDGTIKWDQGIDFTSGGSGNFVNAGSGVVTDDGGVATRKFGVSLKPGEQSLSGKVDDYDYKLTFKPTPGKLEVEVEISRKDAGIELSVSAKGFVNKFRTSADIAIAGGETTSASMSNDSVFGEMNLSFTAGKPTNADSSGQTILKIPFSFKIPIPMPGGFPAFVQVQAGFAITMALTSTNASAAGSYVIPFHGSAGFQLPAGAGDPTPAGAMEADPKIGDGTTTTSLGVSAMGVQVGFPHIGLGIGVSELQTMAYVSQVTSAQLKTPGELGLIHCQAHSLELSTQVGVQAEVFGLKFNSASKELYKKSVDLTLPEGTSCN